MVYFLKASITITQVRVPPIESRQRLYHRSCAELVMVNNLSAVKQKTDPKSAQILRIISPSLSYMGLREGRHT